MNERLQDNSSNREKDPRSELMGYLRNIAKQAIKQQAERDIIPLATRPPGFIFKTDGNHFKVHLQPPATDHAFEGVDSPAKYLPPIWVRVPISGRPESLEADIDFASGILMDIYEDDKPKQLMVEETRIGPAPQTFEDALSYQALDESEQLDTARYWYEQISNNYDLRTITATDNQSAA